MSVSVPKDWSLFKHINYSDFDVKVLLVLLLTAAAADAQSFHLGSCPQPPVQEDFNITKVRHRSNAQICSVCTDLVCLLVVCAVLLFLALYLVDRLRFRSLTAFVLFPF